jgi:proteic killer suppression protein
VIESFRDSDTELFWNTGKSRRLPAEMRAVAARKLFWLHSAADLSDLKSPPGNRLEALKGDRQGQHSIRINDQYRVCFVWHAGNAHEGEVVDYH